MGKKVRSQLSYRLLGVSPCSLMNFDDVTPHNLQVSYSSIYDWGFQYNISIRFPLLLALFGSIYIYTHIYPNVFPYDAYGSRTFCSVMSARTVQSLEPRSCEPLASRCLPDRMLGIDQQEWYKSITLW